MTIATTRIIPMHITKGKTLAQSISDRTDYGLNPEKTNGGELTSAYACDPHTFASEVLISKRQYYHDDEVHIRQILEASGLVPKGGMELAAATIRGLILTVSHQGEIGALYPQVLETLVRGACKELFD